MFQTLLENSNLPAEQVKNVLTEILVKAQQNPSDVSQAFSNLQQFDQIEKYLSQYWKISIQIALQILSVQQCYQFMNQQQVKPSLKLLVFLNQQLCSDKCQTLLKLSEKHLSIHKQLVILKLITNNSIKIIQPSAIPFLFPKVVRLEAFILEKYFKVKNQPASDSSDYLQNDIIMIKNCEKWVASCLSQGFINLPKIQDKQRPLKQAVIVCISQIYGALIEALRQNNLNSDLINQVMCEIDGYLFKNFTLQEIYRKYIKDLRTVNFQNSHQKLIIKQAYTPEMKINDPGFGHIVLKYVSVPCLQINVNLRYLVPALAQNINNPYPIKIDLQRRIEEIIQQQKNSIVIISQYPIQLFLFYIQQFAQQAFNQLNSKLTPANKECLLNSLIILKEIKLGESSLYTKRDIYILKQVQKNGLLSLPRSLILLRMIKFEGVSTQMQQMLLDQVKKYRQLHGINSQFQEIIQTKIKQSTSVFQEQLQNILKAN